MKNFAVHVEDEYGATRLIWFDTNHDMVNEYNRFLHLLAMDKGIRAVHAFSLCAGETRENWVKSMGG